MSPQAMRRLRRWHLYLGLVFAPAIVFFAFSGMIQTIGWQDGPAPAAWIRVIAGVHTHQALPRPPRPAAAHAHDDHDEHEHDHDHEHEPAGRSTLPLRVFVVLVSLGLIASAALGIAIALGNRATRRASWTMLAIGVLLPVALLVS